jgi:peptidoglycan/LPS O-acetylase OafA/YrhL
VRTHNELWADYGYLSCMDGIAIGCLAALIAAKLRFNPKANLALRITGTLLCLLITVFRGTAARLALYKVGLDVTTVQVGTALLVIAMQQSFETRTVREGSVGLSSGVRSRTAVMFRSIANALSRSTAFLRWFGRNSYEVYLTHMLVVWPMVMLFFHFRQSLNTAPLWFLATAALAGVAGHVVARFYSEPLNDKLRMRFKPPARSATVAGS